MEVKLATHKDLLKCAKILMEEYNNNVLNEGWTRESSTEICEYYFKKQPDLFFVAQRDGVVAGFTFSYVRPWVNGKLLMIEEISVKEEYRRQGIAKSLLTILIETAKQRYNITCVKGTTYNNAFEMPFSWYGRIGFNKVESLYLVEGEASTILKLLKK